MSPELLDRPATREALPRERPPVVVPFAPRILLPDLNWQASTKHNWLCVAASVALHASVVMGVTMGAIDVAEYGMSAAQGGVTEISFVTDDQPVSVHQTVSPQLPTPPPDPEAIPVHDPKAAPDPMPMASQASTPASIGPASTEGQGQAVAIPGYLSNPPPPYPLEARRQKQEGRVLLEVFVTRDGKVENLRLKQSSGFPLLDDAALRAVRSWRFKPAKIAGMTIATKLDVPIRFQIKNV